MGKHFKAAGMAALMLVLVAAGFAGCDEPPERQSITAISASGMKQEFYVGDEFDAGKMTVIARYDDGSTEKLGTDAYTVDASMCDMYVAGEYPVTVCAVGTEIGFTYSVSVAELPFDGKYLEVSAAPKTYKLGDDFDAEGIEVILHGARTEESRMLSPAEYTIDSSAFDSTREGRYDIRVRTADGELSTRYTVTVRRDYTQSFKVLAIGNSFSDDATEYLYDIAKAYGSQEVVIGNMFVGACTLSQHRAYAQNNQAVYEYRKNTTGSIVTKTNYRLLDALRDEEWDLICLQQASQESGQSATYHDDLTFMVSYVKQYRTNPDGAIAWHMTWAYQQDSTHWAFPVYESDQRVMYESIVNAVKTNVVPNESFDYILPVGTAIQNARTSTLGDTLTRDGYHLTLDTGRFIAALTWYLEITGEDVEALPVSVVPSATASVLDIVKDAVSSALRYPFSVTQSAYPKTEAIPLEDYTRLSAEFVSGYWEACRSDELIADAENSSLFAASAQRFTPEMLPPGTVITLQEGWRLRAEAWSDEFSFARPQNSLDGYTVIDQSWWDGYAYRAFNLSKVTGEPVTAEEAMQAVGIYVPKTVSYK